MPCVIFIYWVFSNKGQKYYFPRNLKQVREVNNFPWKYVEVLLYSYETGFGT